MVGMKPFSVLWVQLGFRVTGLLLVLGAGFLFLVCVQTTKAQSSGKFALVLAHAAGQGPGSEKPAPAPGDKSDSKATPKDALKVIPSEHEDL